MRQLRQLTATWAGDNQPCWIDPTTVFGLFPAGMPATTRVEYKPRGVVLVLGTPDDVYAALFTDQSSAGEFTIQVVAPSGGETTTVVLGSDEHKELAARGWTQTVRPVSTTASPGE